MCMTGSMVSPIADTNYDGGRIIHECIVPSSRHVINADMDYDIDVREFLVSTKNEVILKTIRKDVKAFLLERFGERSFVPGESMNAWEFFTSRLPGSYDFRVRIICEYVAGIVSYKTAHTSFAGAAQKSKGKRGTKDAARGATSVATTRDPWLFPDELLASREGDCEDISLLLASLFLSAGISAYNVRVALGSVVERGVDGNELRHDHMWVMYKTEAGAWSLIEPLLCVKNVASPKRKRAGNVTSAPRKGSVSVRYEPRFTFNDAHLWSQTSDDVDFSATLAHLAEEWHGLDPGFAGTVHKNLLDTALQPARAGSELADIHADLGARFMLGGTVGLPLLGSITIPFIDEVDNFLLKDAYDPLDHFDSACIVDACTRLNERIAAAKRVRYTDPAAFRTLLKFVFHATADFYAHSSYMHFYARGRSLTQTSIPEIFDFAANNDALAGAVYDTGDLSLGSSAFAFCPGFAGDTAAAIASMRGRVISGRYGIPDDPQGQSPIERSMNASIPFIGRLFPGSVRNVAAMLARNPRARLMPHHDTMAVDEADATNALYPRKADHTLQFHLRKNAAIRHMQTILIRDFGFAATDFATPYVRTQRNGSLYAGIL